MARLTDEQRALSAAVESMIELDGMLRRMKTKKWFSGIVGLNYPDPIIKKLAEILSLTVENFLPCIFIKKDGIFKLRTGETGIKVYKRHIEGFMAIMDGLRADCQSCEAHPHMVTMKNVIYEHPVNKSTTDNLIFFKRRKTAKKMELKDPAAIKILDDWTEEDYARMKKGLNAPASFNETFDLHYDLRSAFADSLQTEILSENNVGSPRENETIGLLQIVRYIFAKYYFEFRSFERIKGCQHCGKVFIEKRTGRKMFCSHICRKKHYDTAESDEKRKCRERQNAWIKYLVGNIRRFQSMDGQDGVSTKNVVRGDCIRCSVALPNLKGGRCPALRKKNKNIFRKS
jgi:hypothetical protein